MKANNGMISEAALLNTIMEVLRLKPELLAALPAGCNRKAYWREIFTRNAEMRRVMEVFRELPLFNELAPGRRTAAGWNAIFLDFRHQFDVGTGDLALRLLQEVINRANRKPAIRRPIRRWRDAYGPNEVLQRIRPVESNAWLPNPHRGTTTFQRFQGDPLYPSWGWSDTHGPLTFAAVDTVRENVKYIPRTTLSYCRWPWAWLEPKRGQYRWDIVDQALRTARERGQTLQLRVQPYTARVDYDETPPTSKRHPPRKSVNVPDWYWDTGAAWIDQGHYAANEPDCNDPRYIRHFGNFVRAFAKRYDGHPHLESVDLAYAGFWGESGGNTTPATAATLADIYLRSFKRTQIITMLGTHGCKYTAATRRRGTLPVGWRADCFGDLKRPDVPEVPRDQCNNHTFNSYPQSMANCQVTETWRTAPVTMETCGTVAGWFLEDYDLDTIMREGYRYHMSVFMPKAVFFPAAMRDKLIEFDKKIGYRFALRQAVLPLEAKRGEAIRVEFMIDNVGCAPIYRPYRLALRFRQRGNVVVVPLAADIRKWEPGHTCFAEMVTLPQQLKPGEAKVDVAIIGDDDRPRVWFAMDAKTKDGWHPLTSLDVVAGPKRA